MARLTQGADGPGLVVCATCRFTADAREDADGVRGGMRLLEVLRTQAAGDPTLADLAIEPTVCLFACSQHCTVHLRAPGKVSYVMGSFQPTASAAQALLDYARCYMASEEGSVPYRQWPDGVKGHFIVRTPPEGRLVSE